MKALVLLNNHAGALPDDPRGRDAIRRRFADSGADIETRLVDPRWLEQNTREAVGGGAEVIIAGGGDGTLNTIANLIAGSDKALGVLPLGAHNHFARALGVPMNLDDAIASLVHGTVREIPIAQVNGRLFLTFSAAGLTERRKPLDPRGADDARGAQAREPALAFPADDVGRQSRLASMAGAAWTRLTRRFQNPLHLRARGHTVSRDATGFVICNHPPLLHSFGIDDATLAEPGLMNVYVVNPHSPNLAAPIVPSIASGSDRRVGAARFDRMALPELTVEARRRRMRVWLDGDEFEMICPLRYRMRPQGLRVLMPGPPMTLSRVTAAAS
jgi:diacylglycerol kinase family enzyme